VFLVRDSQFKQPEIGVPRGSAGQIILKILFIFRYLFFRTGPRTAAVGLGQALPQAGQILARLLIFEENEGNGPASGSPLWRTIAKPPSAWA
jgi:hypothetical protein